MINDFDKVRLINESSRPICLGDGDLMKVESAFNYQPSSFTMNENVTPEAVVSPEPEITPVMETPIPSAVEPKVEMPNTVAQEEVPAIETAPVVDNNVSAIPETPVIPIVDPVEEAIESTVNAVPVTPVVEPIINKDEPVFVPQSAQEFHESEEKESVDVATRAFNDLKELVDENRNLRQENAELKQKIIELSQRTVNPVNQVSNQDPTLVYNQAA